MKIKSIDSITTKIIKPTKKSTTKVAAEQPVIKKLKAKKYPNWYGAPGENYGNNVSYKIAYYPEDIEKMKSMTEEDVWRYKAELRAKGRCFKDTRPVVFSEKFTQFMKEYHLELEQFIVN